jgi:tRNA nucleotidyltransferase (CCA-adding enzyme)
MTYDEFKQNFLPEFLNINSYAGRMRYADQNLQRIGSGSGRRVYDIDGEKVLKLAMNAKGVAQNGAEAGAGYYRDTQHIVTEVFDSADDDTWLISEKAKKVNEKRIKELTGIPSLSDLLYFLKNQVSQNNGRRKIFSQTPETEEFMWENEFASDLIDFVVNYGQTPGDMGRPSTYGEVLRDGQPTIVLTDYGLNDEVYDTHYSPDRKQKYRMYELFNYADGNDDILSDTGDQGDIKRGMWAQMPYDVGDGQGVINEKFVDFVSKHDKYPNKSISGLPILTDNFHECVNNIKETLKRVKNKKQFYNNLLELQNYLIRRGFYDRESLINEETIAVKQYSLEDRNYSDKLAKEVAGKLGLTTPKYLGGGANGFAYKINDNLIMKLTSDVSEADAASKLLRRKPEYIATVYNLYKIIDTDTNQAFFVIMQENINDKPTNKFIKAETDIQTIAPAGLTYVDILRKMKTSKRFNYDELVEVAKHILTDNPEAGVSPADRQIAYDFLIGMLNIRKELLEFDIKSTDYIEMTNLGYKDGVLKFFDTGGYYGVGEPEIKDDNIIQLPENLTEEQLEEDYSREKADNIAKRITTKLGLQDPKYIGHGSLGVAYDIGDDKVLKITKDNSEAYENLKLVGEKLKYIADVYRVFEVTPKNIPEGEKKTYAIILEKLKQDKPFLEKMYNRINYVFGNIFKTNIKDAVLSYLNGYRNDDDPIDKTQVNNYFKKNPKDGEFFFGLVRIAEELQEHGIDSYDFFNTDNLGYKQNGALGFFDVGFTNGFAEPQGAEQMNVEVDEDGTAKFTTNNAICQDDFPSYDSNDTSPSINNNLDANVASQMYEDLEYNHVVGDASEDEYELTEDRKKSYMTGSKTVKVKRKCQLAGLGNTSVACNQGDINNLEFGSVNENDLEVSEYYGSLVPDINEAEIMNLNDLPFKKEIEELGGKIHSVGGTVRDEFLGKPSKDLDILIAGIPMDKLEQILSKYGRVDAVGKSFGVLKFKPKGATEDIDIAIPRTEKPTGEGGHKGFEVSSSHDLPIEKDLERRDFTINAIARDSEGNIIDPYGGQEDLKNKIIRVVNPEAFSDDPLRMLRAVQFASRFGFDIEPETRQMIKDNTARIKEIPPERILTEFNKIVKKGNAFTGAHLLKDLGLRSQIFGNEGALLMNGDWDNVQTMGEFIWLLSHNIVENPAEYFKNNLKGDIDSYKEIKAIDNAYQNETDNEMKNRIVAHNVYSISPKTLNSKILPDSIKKSAQELLKGKYPKTVNELAVNGNDLMEKGLQGKAVGDMQKSLLINVYADKIRNSKEELLSLVNQKDKEIQEGFPNWRDMQPKTWNVNGKQVTIDFFVQEYDKWNYKHERFRDASRESVLRFLEDEFPEFAEDEKLNKELYWELTDRELLNEDEMKKVSYSAVVLDDKSKATLIKIFKPMIPKGWEVICHHMTIKMGALENGSQEQQDMIDKKMIMLDVVDYAMDELVMAVGVKGYPTTNSKPHITIAVNRDGGGKPFMSNKLTDWRPMGFPIELTGKVSEEE